MAIEDYLRDEQRLHALVGDRVEETSRLDFKRDPYQRTEGDRRELRRDATSIANASGGFLVIGVDDENDRAVAVPGVAAFQTEATAMRDALNASITPPLEARAFRVRSIALSNGNGVVILEIPPSAPGSPHAVTENNRPAEFWIRRDRTKQRMVYDEIRERFSRGDASDLGAQALVRIEAAIEALRLTVQHADEPPMARVRSQLETAGYQTRVYVEPIRPDRFRDDVFHVREVAPDYVTLEKESNGQSVAIPLAHVQSFAPRGGGDGGKLLALRPPGRLIWDTHRWRFSMGSPPTKP
ncbi:MAG: ATP-binding protein [Kofleriaceae bacterium]|nr:ATP-binding protein [Myxococcales bacterium]MCB9570879.1 ATP-binding protein [Kofleriaceae bacterium]